MGSATTVGERGAAARFDNARAKTVGVGDMKTARPDADLIVTHGLGSCVGIALYDTELRLGAMLHAMLPTYRLSNPKTEQNPWLFVDTGVPAMFRACYILGAEKGRMLVYVAGGAAARSARDDDEFEIGKRNTSVTAKLLQKNGIPVKTWDVGGSHARTLILDVRTGQAFVKIAGQTKPL